jgi:hypothetical protein
MKTFLLIFFLKTGADVNNFRERFILSEMLAVPYSLLIGESHKRQ